MGAGALGSVLVLLISWERDVVCDSSFGFLGRGRGARWWFEIQVLSWYFSEALLEMEKELAYGRRDISEHVQ